MALYPRFQLHIPLLSTLIPLQVPSHLAAASLIPLEEEMTGALYRRVIGSLEPEHGSKTSPPICMPSLDINMMACLEMENLRVASTLNLLIRRVESSSPSVSRKYTWSSSFDCRPVATDAVFRSVKTLSDFILFATKRKKAEIMQRMMKTTLIAWAPKAWPTQSPNRFFGEVALRGVNAHNRSPSRLG